MKYLKLLLIIAIIVILLFFFLKDVDLAKVKEIIYSVDLIYPLVFLLGLFVQFFLRGYRWGLILKPHKKNIPLMTLYNYTVIGFLLNLIPGKVGEAARGILLAKEEKIKPSYGLASVVLERLIDSTMLLVLFWLSFFILPDSGSPLLSNLKTVSFFVFPIILLFFFLFYFFNTDRMFGYVERVIRFCAKIIPQKFRERLIRFAISFVKGLRLNLSLPDFFKLIFSSVVVWIFLIPFYWYLMQGFGFGKNIGLVDSVPFFCVLVASAAIPTPGMAGSFDAACKLGLKELHHVASDPAAAYTLLAHVMILVVMIVPGLIAFWTKGIRLQTIKEIRLSKDHQSLEQHSPEQKEMAEKNGSKDNKNKEG